MIITSFQVLITPKTFSFQCSLLIPLETSENQKFSDVFRGIKREHWEGKGKTESRCYTGNVLQIKTEVEFKIQVNWKKFKDTLKPIKFMLKLEKTILGNVVIWEKIGLK